ncbi:MAG: bifunctional glutamate N-acetyltransferase/amino-acid acetyltransferase ArgJ [Filifactor alocis]|nr:bifunctional glutamate N-acetyltransferase/amino-acid acetyltransferase ArgJ [Filifactor alocis]
MDTYRFIEGGITAPKGFKAGAIYCGIKSKKKEKPDIAILYSEEKAVCAGMFTTNKFAAAPIIYCREIVKTGSAQAILINSGNANAATGTLGLENTRKLAQCTGDHLGLQADDVFVCSTGVIGVQLPMEKMLNAVKDIVPTLSADNGPSIARAIMTTDTVPKEISFELELSGGTIRIGSMAKGSGMIHPNMATMLAFVTTDATISQEVLQGMLKKAVDKSYNMMTVDGDTSTNDCLLLLANGMSGVEVKSEEDIKKFYEAIEYISMEMAKKIAADGEGASHLIVVHANNLQTQDDARKVARAVAGSNLFKCAIFGQDANWGRVISAAGYSGAEFETGKIDVALESKAGKIDVMLEGAGLAFDEEKAATILKEKDIYVYLDFHDGEECATAFGCDLTYDYVKINGDYRS